MQSQASLDPVTAVFSLRKENKTFNWYFCAAALMVFTFSLYMYTWQYQFTVTDLFVHARIAGEFDFTDLHSITSRLAYPVWHLCTAVLYQLGVPLIWAAAFVCAAAKTFSMWLVWLLLRAISGDKLGRIVPVVSAVVLMMVTSIRIPSINPEVYKAAGSPTVWHNPTQLMANVSMLLCVPYLAHCWYGFAQRVEEKKKSAVLPWYQPVILGVLLMFSLACKPTFLQALLPAAAIFFGVQWLRHPKHSPFFFQIILAFLPAALYFLLQYLYYTGVVVPFSSGVAFGITWDSTVIAVRSMLLMAAFPLWAFVCCNRKEILRDKMLVITLLMAVCSVLQSMCFRETGVRWGHGNFNWASMSVALMLWVLMLGYFLNSFSEYRKEKSRSPVRGLAFGVGFALLLWHIYSGVYYLYFLFTSNAAF